MNESKDDDGPEKCKLQKNELFEASKNEMAQFCQTDRYPFENALFEIIIFVWFSVSILLRFHFGPMVDSGEGESPNGKK